MMRESTLKVWPMDDHNFRVSQASEYVSVLANPYLRQAALAAMLVIQAG